MIDGVFLTKLNIIQVKDGDVYHAMKKTDPGYSGFGEAYFSTIHRGSVKAWKRHREMTLNLIVPIGEIGFVLMDDRADSKTSGATQEIILSKSNYYRLTIPPMVWMGFVGVGSDLNMLLNLANIEHEPTEADKKAQEAFNYNWESLL